MRLKNKILFYNNIPADVKIYKNNKKKNKQTTRRNIKIIKKICFCQEVKIFFVFFFLKVHIIFACCKKVFKCVFVVMILCLFFFFGYSRFCTHFKET